MEQPLKLAKNIKRQKIVKGIITIVISKSDKHEYIKYGFINTKHGEGGL